MSLPTFRQPTVHTEAKTGWFSFFQLSISLSTCENRKTNPKCQLWVYFTSEKIQFLENWIHFLNVLFSVLSMENWTDKRYADLWSAYFGKQALEWGPHTTRLQHPSKAPLQLDLWAATTYALCCGFAQHPRLFVSLQRAARWASGANGEPAPGETKPVATSGVWRPGHGTL